MFKKIISHTLLYGISPQIVIIANFLTLPLITKDLTEVDFGISGTVTAYVSALTVLSNLGLNIVLVNSFFKSPMQYKWRWRQIYGFLNVWNIFFALVLGIVLFFTIPKEAIENRLYIILLSILPFLAFGQTLTIGRNYFQLNQKPKPIAIRSLIFGLLATGLNVLFINYFKLGYMGWFLSTCISTILSSFSYWYPLYFKENIRPIYKFKWKYLKTNLIVSLPTIPHFYGSQLLNSSDRMVMDMVNVRTDDIGKFNVANTFSVIGDGLSTATSWAISPMLNTFYKNNEFEKAKYLIFVIQILFFSLTFLISIWLKEIFYILISNVELRKVYPLGIILFMAYNYRPMYFGANGFLFFYERTNRLWRLSFVAATINIGLNFILIPIYGFEIATITTFISFLYMGYAGFYFKDFKELNNVNYYPFVWFVLTILLSIAAYFIVELNVGIKVFISFLFLLVCFYYLVLFNKKLR